MRNDKNNVIRGYFYVMLEQGSLKFEYLGALGVDVYFASCHSFYAFYA
jgi:hypothetical protein